MYFESMHIYILLYTTNDDVLFIINMIASSVCSNVHDDYFFRSIIHDFSDVLQLYRLLKITVRFFNNRPTLFFKTFLFLFYIRRYQQTNFTLTYFLLQAALVQSPIDLFAIISTPAQKRFRTAKLPDSIAKYCLHWLR